ncbi:IS200/IS605 family accessory protein TnpB-related protein [Streptomyces sp. NPDC047024]|uniref:IS200/IS605 family accessory protein TnpB-related protein n=1 Tax=Streptomyces sp. NPDC047024 TaxID=3155476 RepID=UPI0033EBDF31
MGGLREVAAPFVVPAPSGVALRDRLKRLSAEDERVLRLVGDHLGSLASSDLKARCTAGLGHASDRWAERKRVLTAESSSRWAGSLTKATHDQWALARRAQLAHVRGVEAGVRAVAHRLSLPVGEKGSGRAPGGYRSRREWHAKSRRLRVLEDRLRSARADWEAGVVRVVRGGKRLLNSRRHLDAAGLTEQGWRERWRAARRFLAADGESGKRYGNETIRISPDGEVSIKLPAPLAHLANAPHGRYVLSARVVFAHRGERWRDRVTANRAVACRIHEDIVRGRWYLTAFWSLPAVTVLPLPAARTRGLIGVDMNGDHLAAWRLDVHGNPVGAPRTFGYDLSGTASHRDAQLRHALIRLVHWVERHHLAIAVEDLDFTAETTREKYGRKERFRRLVSGMPTSRLRAIRRRKAPPRHHQSDDGGHRTVQAGPGAPGREEPRPRVPGPRTRSVRAGRGAKAGDQRAQHRSGHAAEHETWKQDLLPLSFQERYRDPHHDNEPPGNGPGRGSSARFGGRPQPRGGHG